MKVLSFGANFISKANVKKHDDGKKVDTSVSFVELDENNKKDCDAIEYVSKTWGDDSYVQFIGQVKLPPEVESKVFALTQQKANFDNLEPDKILGVLEMHESCGDRMINVMQVNPEDITKNKTRKFSKVGSALISSLSKFYNHEPIRVYSAHDAVDFYKKAGFVFCRPDTYSNEMILDA